MPKHASPAIGRARFVLSAGRTGTVWLYRLLKAGYPELTAVHEPFPARFEQALGNMRNATGLGTGLLQLSFEITRSKRIARLEADRTYVEINPLLCPIVDVLMRHSPINCIHMVREPRSWVRSILSFKASKTLRPVIDHIPFALPYPFPRPDAWSRLSQPEKALWRWRFCNEQILRVKDECSDYHLVRHEDLFQDDPNQREDTLRSLLAALGVADDRATFATAFNSHVNRAPHPGYEIPDEPVYKICGPLLSQFGYV